MKKVSEMTSEEIRQALALRARNRCRIDPDKILQTYLDGATIAETARANGCSTGTVVTVLKKAKQS